MHDDHYCVCPYGKVGDRLWVRETFGESWHHAQPDYFYRADDNASIESHPDFDGWKPSIHMPRLASRITLEITGVRVERLNNIHRSDAIAEGCEMPSQRKGMHRWPEAQFADLWESINGPGSWDANPWVWVVEFKRIEA